MKTAPQTVYAFIDSQNLNLGIRSLGWKLDWGKFRQYLRNKYQVTKAYLFIGHVEGNESLYTSLQEAGFLLVFKPTLEHKEDDKVIIKGNVDAELVLHTMIQYSNFAKAVIVTGDGDFHCLVDHLVTAGKLQKLIVPSSHYSSLLRKFHNKKYIARIDQLRKSLEYRGTSSKKKATATPQTT
jgi:uncharacterized LabA/DUF88 family protein